METKWALLLFVLMVGNHGSGDRDHNKLPTTCIKRPRVPKFLPVPIPLSTDTIRRKLTGPVWVELYFNSPQDTNVPGTDAVQLRFKFDISDDGNMFNRTVSLRTSINGDCILLQQAYKRSTSTKRKGIFLREEGDSMRQERFFSSCPDQYVWLWICLDCRTIKNGRCMGDAFLALLAKDPANNVPFDLVAKDLKKYGLSFDDPRFKITHDGLRCPI